MTSPVEVVLVGCGVIGWTHAAALQELAEGNIVGVVDPAPAAAEALARSIEDRGKPKPSVFTSLQDALTSSQVDLVVLCTPSGLHVEQGLEVLRAGKHLVIEKPLDVDLARALRFEKAAVEAAGRGLVVSVISQHRFDRASRALAGAIRDSRLGTITSAIASVAWWRSQQYYESGSWRGTWSMDGGGALMNQGVHTVDLLLQFMGRPVEVYAQTALLGHEGIEVEDTAAATIRFEGGALALLHATTAAYPGLTVRLQVMGTDGSAVVDGDQLEYFHSKHAPSGDLDRIPDGQGNHAAHELARFGDDVFPPGSDPQTYPLGHVRQYRDVLAAIASGHQPEVTVSDAVHALALIRAVYVSATLNRPVLFTDVLEGDYDGVAVQTGYAVQPSV
ncbi:Gfo/Idh/MocA family protein [Arthrobacter sp. NPDC057388]|uniref:Gfo/Idh/MocA family protein n=1 Tax=Arthrobacter sp. NPDC057388 TaxID=3346116 RepID=UPI00363A5CDE